MPSSTATLIGCGAVALWSLLAILTAATGPVPPLQLTAMTFAIGGSLGLAIAALRGRLGEARPQPVGLVLGLYGILGDTALYFAALKLAPAAEANLVHYLWPLLIVLFAALLPGERLKTRHLVGALLGLAAVVVLIAGRLGGETTGAAWLGYGFAAAGAFVWASFSVASRRLAAVPTESVAATCLTGAMIAAMAHLAFETTRWPATLVEWIGTIGLGLGPMGAAFFVWDIGMKRGNVPLLGVISYAAPVLSTLILVAAGYASASLALFVACGLIVAGALVATAGRS